MGRVDNNYYLRIQLSRKKTNQEAVKKLVKTLQDDPRVGKAFTGKTGSYGLAFNFHSAKARFDFVALFRILLQPDVYTIHYEHDR